MLKLSTIHIRSLIAIALLFMLTACPALGPECVEADEWGDSVNKTIRIDPSKRFTSANVNVQQGAELEIDISGLIDICPDSTTIGPNTSPTASYPYYAAPTSGAPAAYIDPRYEGWQDSGLQLEEGQKFIITIRGTYRDVSSSRLNGQGLYAYIGTPPAGSGGNDATGRTWSMPVETGGNGRFFELYNNGTTGTNGSGYVGIAPASGNLYFRYARNADLRTGLATSNATTPWRGVYKWEGSRCDACRQTTIFGACAGALMFYWACVAGWEGGCAGTGHLERNPGGMDPNSSYRGSKCQEWYGFGSECRDNSDDPDGRTYWGHACFDHWVDEDYTNNSGGYEITVSDGCPGTFGKHMIMDIGRSTVTIGNFVPNDCSPSSGSNCTRCPSGSTYDSDTDFCMVGTTILQGPIVTVTPNGLPACNGCDMNSSGRDIQNNVMALPPNFTSAGRYDGVAPASGELWFEIIDQAQVTSGDPPPGFPNGIYSDNVGSYNVTIRTDKVDSRLSSFLDGMIDPMRYIIFGRCRVPNDPSTAANETDLTKDKSEEECNEYISANPSTPPGKWEPGVTRKLYNQLAGASSFVNFVRAIMVLMVVIYGFMFMLGMIEHPQELIIKTTLKVGVLSILISPGSWEFFSQHLFGFFINGVNYFISIMAGDFMGALVQSGQNNITSVATVDNPFAFIDGTITRFVNWSTFIKVIGLLFSSVFGFLYMIILLVGVWYFLKAIIIAAVLYIFSMLAISLLLILAPIFIAMILFKYTQDYFFRWFLSLLSYMLQPVLVVTTLSIFNVFVYSVLYQTLHYTVCWETIFSLNIQPLLTPSPLDFSIPIFRFYRAVGGIDGNPLLSSGLPMGLFVMLIFILVTNAMLKFVDFMSSIASKIAVGADTSLAAGAKQAVEAAGAMAAGAVAGVFKLGRAAHNKAKESQSSKDDDDKGKKAGRGNNANK